MIPSALQSPRRKIGVPSMRSPTSETGGTPRTVGVANVYDGGSTEDGRLWILKTPSGTMLRASELPFQLNTASLQWGE